MRKVLFIIAALVCAGTLNLYAEDTRTVITECSFTGFDPSLIKVGYSVGSTIGKLVNNIKTPEDAVYYVAPTMYNITKWDDATHNFKRMEDNSEVLTKGVYYFWFQVRIDNHSGDGYGDAYRFPKSGEGCITFTMNGEYWGEECAAAVYDGVCWGVVISPAFVVGYDDFKEVGNLPGVFSVAADKHIQFAQGNLQYQCADKEWKFAETQYDVIGSANTNIAENYDGWIDLFGWGTSGYNGRNPWLNTTNDTDYGNPDGNTRASIAGTNYDWGVYNAISNGGNEAGLWRTLTKDEWKYLFAERENAAALRSKATVAGKEGLILLPDDWDTIAKPLAATLNNFTDVTLTVKAWLAWEVAGAVFLPKAGTRYPYNGTYSGASCTYATGTFDQSYSSYRNCFTFDLSYATTADGIGTASYQMGVAVRLAKDVSRIYKVTINQSTGGTITVDEPEGLNLDSVPYGTEITFLATPDTENGYEVADADAWVNATALGNHVYATATITSDTTISCAFTLEQYEVLFSAAASPAPAPQREGESRAPMVFAGGHVECQAIPTAGDPVTVRSGDYVDHGTLLRFTASADDPGFTFDYWSNGALSGNVQELVLSADVNLVAFFKEIHEGIEDVQGDEVQGTKILRDGELLIIRNGKTYNALGAEIK